jgi:hypothetical protein
MFRVKHPVDTSFNFLRASLKSHSVSRRLHPIDVRRNRSLSVVVDTDFVVKRDFLIRRTYEARHFSRGAAGGGGGGSKHANAKIDTSSATYTTIFTLNKNLK